MNTNDKTSGNPRKGDTTRRPTAGAYPAARGSQPPAQRTAPETGDVLARRWTARAALLVPMLAVLPLATAAQVVALVAEFIDALRGEGPFVAGETFGAHGEALEGDPEARALYDAVLAVLLGMTAGHALDLEENATANGGINPTMLDAARTNVAALRAHLVPTPDDASNNDKADARRRSVILATLATLTPNERAVALPLVESWLHTIRGHHLMLKAHSTDTTRQMASDGHYAATTQIMEGALPYGAHVVFDALAVVWFNTDAYEVDHRIVPNARTKDLAAEVNNTLGNVDDALEDIAWVAARFALAGGAR